ncbi:MAG TPA: alpha/beta hydrolase-fold protein [Verrucomicrobiae bacterium]|nr:alpha/beta hydrolase-fold protein [Verrucomicrobiae bacterium]
MTVRMAVAVLAVLAMLPAASSPDLVASLDRTASDYFAGVAAIADVTGRDDAIDYYQRLEADVAMQDEPPPEGTSDAAWQATVRQIAQLDLSAARQLLARSYAPMAQIRGLGETFVQSSVDGTMQAVAVYVPSTYVPGRPSPLVVFLHGRPQTETQLLAPPFVADLAERSGAIVVAPYGRGYYDFEGSERDVYDALHAAERAFTIDPRKRYLAGYSMGGFSVFRIAPVDPGAWSAIMDISGALVGSVAREFTQRLKNVPVYVLTGAKDDAIPTRYPAITAIYLRDAGFSVSFYSLPSGTHRLGTLLPILRLALDDMERGIVRVPAGTSTLPLPIAPPAMGLKT